jgi:insulysin
MYLYKEVKQSKVDKRDYLGIELSNKLRCIIVKDTEEKISAASMTVGVGNLSDPTEYQGLAHFLEHMLFLGSEKYPQYGTYKQFIAANGGSSNASTSSHSTNFHFAIPSDKFFAALDIFSQFFICPLLNEDCSNRELNAVDSEASKNYNQDARRLSHLDRHLSGEKSPFNKFSTGNMKTLNKPGLREALVKFYNTYYSSDIMTLSIYHNEDTEKVAEKIQQLFGSIPNKNVVSAIPAGLSHPFPADTHRARLCRVIPVLNKHTLNITFYLPDQCSTFSRKPLKYLAEFMSQTHAGSLKEYLLHQGLIHTFACSSQTFRGLFSNFQLNFDLTDKGLTNIEALLSSVGTYLHQLRQWGPIEWFYDECKLIDKLGFEYRSHLPPLNTANELSENMRNFGVENAVYAVYEYQEFSKETIEEVIGYLTPANCNVYLSSQTFGLEQCSQEEPIYGTRYSLEPLPAQWVTHLSGESPCSFTCSFTPTLPERNNLIPRSFELKAPPANNPEIPTLIEDSDSLTLYHLHSIKYSLPKVIFTMNIYDNTFDHYTDRRASEYYQLWVKIYAHVFRGASHGFTRSDCSVAMAAGTHGLNLTINCFSDTLQAALTEVPKYFAKMKAFNERAYFEDMKEKHIKTLEGSLRAPPSTTCDTTLVTVLRANQPSVEEHVKYVRSEITWERFKEFNMAMFSGSIRFVGLLEGNIDSSTARQSTLAFITTLQRELEIRFNFDKRLDVESRVCKLPEGSTHVITRHNALQSETNSGMLMYFQEGSSKEHRAELCFLTTVGKQLFFHELRTQQQLGYTVSAGLTNHSGIFGFFFFVQSNHKTAEFCREKTDAFIHKFVRSLDALTDKQFEDVAKGLVSQTRKPCKNLVEEASKHWDEISTGRLEFDQKSNFEKQILEMTKSSVIQVAKSLFIERNARIEIHMTANQNLEEYQHQLAKRISDLATTSEKSFKLVEDIENFKKSLELYSNPFKSL